MMGDRAVDVEEPIEVSDSDESSDFIPEQNFHHGTTRPLDASLEDLPSKKEEQVGLTSDLHQKKYIKCFASDLPSGQFDKFKIKFDSEPTDIDEFCKMLKEKKPIQGGPVNNIIETFKQFIKKHLEDLSIDLNSVTEKAKKHFETRNKDNDKEGIEKKLNFAAFNDLKREAFDKIRLSTRNVNKFYTQTIRSEEYNNDEDMLRLLSHWITAVNEFMRSCIDVVRSILHPQMVKTTKGERETEQNTREIVFQSLFTSFSKMFLLHTR